MADKLKRCKQCKLPFRPFNTLQQVCGPVCAIAQAKEKQAKEYKQETNRLKREYYDNDIKHWKTKAQRECNRYILLRDSFYGCISCGTHTAGQYHAGHYRTRKANPEIKLCEWNIHKQCAQCNLFESGNIGNYRINLVKKIGAEMVESIEGHHQSYKYTLDDYKDIFDYYREKIEDMGL